MTDFKERLRQLSANCRANDSLSKFARFREDADAIDTALGRIAELEAALVAMTDDEALAIIRGIEEQGDYIAISGETDLPYFRKGSIVLRGDFFPCQLEAILHFAPKDGK